MSRSAHPGWVARPTRVARYWAGPTLSRRRAGLISIVILIGVLGGVAMGAISAARRTQSAFPAFLRSSQASDVDFQTFNPTNAGGDLGRLARAIGALPLVAHVGTAPQLLVFPSPATLERRPAALSDVQFLGSEGGIYFAQDRVTVVAGRMSVPSRPDEMVASTEAASLLGWHVGETVPLEVFTDVQIDPTFSPVRAHPAARLMMRLVGEVVFANKVVHDDVDRFPTFVLMTPALTRALPKSIVYSQYELRLVHGSRDVATVEREVVNLLPPGSLYTFRVTADAAGQVERAIRPETIAFGVFGLLAALAVVLIAGQAVRRQLWSESDDLDVLRSMGADPSTMVAAVVLAPIIAVLSGTALAVAVAIGLSPLAPVAPVREVDPAPGLAVDVAVVAGGIVLFAGALSALAVWLAVRQVRRRHDDAPRGGSLVASAAARTGLPPPAVMGLRFALERGRGRASVPVRSALLGSVLALAIVAATVTFGASLATLTSHPSLYGWNWNYGIESASGNSVPPVVYRLLRQDPHVAAFSSYDFANAQLDGLTVPLLLGDPHAAIGPPVLTGHALEGAHEVVLGAGTLAELHKRVGETVVASYGSPRDYPVYVPPTRVTIVGTATMPAIGNTLTQHTSMGVGALLARAIEPPAFQQALRNPDPNLNGPGIVVVRVTGGARTAAASLARIARVATTVVADDPRGNGGTYLVVAAQRPAEITIYQSTGPAALVLAGGLALGAMLSLGLTLAASVRRRRRELALLKALGFTRGQLAATLSWQSTVAAAVGIVIGVPAGVAVGRWLWNLFARAIYAAPHPTVPVGELAAIALGALVLANLVAAMPGRIAARTPTATLLRTE